MLEAGFVREWSILTTISQLSTRPFRHMRGLFPLDLHLEMVYVDRHGCEEEAIWDGSSCADPYDLRELRELAQLRNHDGRPWRRTSCSVLVATRAPTDGQVHSISSVLRLSLIWFFFCMEHHCHCVVG